MNIFVFICEASKLYQAGIVFHLYNFCSGDDSNYFLQIEILKPEYYEH